LPNKTYREFGLDRARAARCQGTERIFHTNAEPSTVMTATGRNRVGYPPSWLTSGPAALAAEAGLPVAAERRVRLQLVPAATPHGVTVFLVAPGDAGVTVER
jgi:hypothetical protein